MIPAGIAAGDLGRARSSVAPRRGTSCHVGPGGQAVRVRERRRGVRADARALAGRPTGRDWAERGSGWASALAQARALGRRGERLGRANWAAGSWVGLRGFWVFWALGFLFSFPISYSSHFLI